MINYLYIDVFNVILLNCYVDNFKMQRDDDAKNSCTAQEHDTRDNRDCTKYNPFTHSQHLTSSHVHFTLVCCSLNYSLVVYEGRGSQQTFPHYCCLRCWVNQVKPGASTFTNVPNS